MRALHCISSQWAEPKLSCHAAQGVTKVLYMECYSLHSQGGFLLKQVDYFTEIKLNSNEVKKYPMVSISNLKEGVEERCATHAVLSFE